jgi:AraC-like DNA-binding protein
MLFQIPRSTINGVADELNLPLVDELQYQSGVGVIDETIMHLGLSLGPALSNPNCVSRLFVDHVTLALTSHIAQTYGGMDVASRLIKGGLAPWQERLSKEMIASDLTGSVPLNEIALACGLSGGHFSRAFRRSTGFSPHEWLLHIRIHAAKAMLHAKNISLATVAQACGFAHQGHFSRVFVAQVGMSPSAWRQTALR